MTRQELEYEVKRAKEFFEALELAYGKDDSIVKKYWADWKILEALLEDLKKKEKK